MAFTQSITLKVQVLKSIPGGQTLSTTTIDENFTEIYVKVESVNSSKNKATASISFKLDETQLFYKYYEFPLDLDGPNPIKQAYQFLKTLPEFSNAVDC